MQLNLENHEASLMYRILRNRANELGREIAQQTAPEEIAYMKHKEQILKGILTKLADVDEFVHMKGYKTHQEI